MVEDISDLGPGNRPDALTLHLGKLGEALHEGKIVGGRSGFPVLKQLIPRRSPGSIRCGPKREISMAGSGMRQVSFQKLWSMIYP